MAAIDPVVINFESLDKIIDFAKSLETIDFSPLMEEWRYILTTENANNLGIDGYGVPMQEVTYRPDDKAGTRKPIDYSILDFNNLTSSHYRTLEGPPLSPRGHDSRVTKNFRTWWERDEPQPNDWTTFAGWEDFVSIAEIDILPAHAEGPDHNPNLPIRDLLHIRPGTILKARDALCNFVNRLLGRI